MRVAAAHVTVRCMRRANVPVAGKGVMATYEKALCKSHAASALHYDSNGKCRDSYVGKPK